MTSIRWSNFSDEGLINYAKENFPNYSRIQLKKACKGLTNALYERNLMDMVSPTKGQQWHKMSNEEIVEFFRENYPDAKSRSDLRKLNRELLRKLKERGLLEELFGKSQKRAHRNLTEMSNDELIQTAKQYGELSRTELQFEDSILYRIILKRGLIEQTTIDKKKSHDQYTNWKNKTDEQLISYAKNLVPDLKNKSQLRKADLGLAKAVSKRDLWDELGIKKDEKVSWRNMSDDEIMDHFKKQYEGLSRNELDEACHGLYRQLIERKLIDTAIPEANKKQFSASYFNGMSDKELTDYYQQHYSHITTRTKLSKTCRLLHENLKERGLLDSVGLESKLENPRKLREKSDEELIDYFKKDYSHIISKTHLARTDWVLYNVLRKRKLLEACFEENNGSIESILESYVVGSDD